MEIAFATKLIREICEGESAATRTFGIPVTGKLKRRLADLRAATSVKDLVVGRPRKIDGGGDFKFAIDLCRGYFMVCAVNHVNVPMLDSSDVNWSKVSRVKILKIANENG
jgi:hypothetical protein